MAAQNQTPLLVENLAINTSAVLADSTFRNATDNPLNFNATLSGAIRGGRRVKHTALLWSTPMYAHNRENMMLRYTIEFDPNIYYAFLTPYYIHVSPDGNATNLPLQTPIAGSYAADLQAALNFAVFFDSPTTMAPNALGNPFTVRYSQSLGFVITCTSAFSIDNTSPWLQLAHFTHGFGRLADATSSNKWTLDNGPNLILRSNTAPNLSPSIYVGVTCTELIERRALSSFSNVPSSAFSSSEMNVFPVSWKNHGVFKEFITTDDATIVNMDETYGIQKISIAMYDNNGMELKAQDVLPAVMQQTGILLDCGLTRTTAQTNLLIQLWNPAYRETTSATLSFLFPQGNVTCSTDEIVHKFLVEHPSA